MPKAPFAKGSDTSEAAADSMGESASSLRIKILNLIRSAPGGLTTDEIEVMLRMRHQTASARMWELHKRSLIGDSGKRRKTRSGRMAAVYVAIDPDALAAETKKLATEVRKTAEQLIADAMEIELQSLIEKVKGGPQ